RRGTGPDSYALFTVASREVPKTYCLLSRGSRSSSRSEGVISSPQRGVAQCSSLVTRSHRAVTNGNGVRCSWNGARCGALANGDGPVTHHANVSKADVVCGVCRVDAATNADAERGDRRVELATLK